MRKPDANYCPESPRVSFHGAPFPPSEKKKSEPLSFPRPLPPPKKIPASELQSLLNVHTACFPCMCLVKFLENTVSIPAPNPPSIQQQAQDLPRPPLPSPLWPSLLTSTAFSAATAQPPSPHCFCFLVLLFCFWFLISVPARSHTQ